MNTYRNIWAVVCPARPDVGATVEVTTKSGKVKHEQVSAVVSKCDDGWVCTTGEPLRQSAGDTTAGERLDAALVRARNAEDTAGRLAISVAHLKAALAATATAPEPVTVDVTPEPDAAPAAPESSSTPTASGDGNTAGAAPRKPWMDKIDAIIAAPGPAVVVAALDKPDPVQTARKWATATDGSSSERGPFAIGPGAFRVQL